MSNGVEQHGSQQQGVASFTPFVNFMLTAVPAAIVVVAGWLFGNIFAELQHQRQRQERLVQEVTASQRDLISLQAQFQDTRVFYREELIKQGQKITEIEKNLQRVQTEVDTTQKERELRAIKALSNPGRDLDNLDKVR